MMKDLFIDVEIIIHIPIFQIELLKMEYRYSTHKQGNEHIVLSTDEAPKAKTNVFLTGNKSYHLSKY